MNQVRRTILLTSFATWEPHQLSNASDDLLAEFLKTKPLSADLHVLRQLPVDFQLAPEKAIAHFNQLQPDVILCCGMAQSRTKLSVESRGVNGSKVLKTKINLDYLVSDLTITEISHDAGQFVCNWIYYSMLKHLQEQNSNHYCLFVHVPILTSENLTPLLADFRLIIERILILSQL